MAELDPSILTVLSAESTLTAIVGARIYNEEAPQNPTYPLIVYSIFIDEVDTQENNSDRALVQFDILGATKSQCISIRGPLRTAMDNTAVFKAWFAGLQSSTPDDNLDISHEILTYNVVYNR